MGNEKPGVILLFLREKVDDSAFGQYNSKFILNFDQRPPEEGGKSANKTHFLPFPLFGLGLHYRSQFSLVVVGSNLREEHLRVQVQGRDEGQFLDNGVVESMYLFEVVVGSHFLALLDGLSLFERSEVTNGVEVVAVLKGLLFGNLLHLGNYMRGAIPYLYIPTPYLIFKYSYLTHC